MHDLDLAAMSITVGEVRVSPDLRIATAYVLPLGGKDADEAIVALNRSKGELRYLVARVMKLKFAPELRFVIDETFEQMEKTRRLLAEDRVQRDIAKRDEDDNGDDDGDLG
ncbi:Ribosome-binding factor A [Defluviimonas aquaemixtae]|uniref:Ribosome-binding factor A n=1 Tax=Albidovulum aquaemixtae TaxID=1542388 RepID=A0A2R8BN50_9RHOB|nr:Ribosome-binding factor A [Defluviimonas aquaemixtae]